MAINTINGTLVAGIPIANVTGLQAALDAAGVGTFEIENITGLQTALDGKADTGDSITASQISNSTTVGRSMLMAANATAQAALLPVVTRAARGMVPTAPAGTGTSLFLREDQTWATPVVVDSVSDVRLGATSSSAAGGHVLTEATVAYVASPAGITSTFVYRPIQKNVNGTWITVTSI
jgi:hypothetical protein